MALKAVELIIVGAIVFWIFWMTKEWLTKPKDKSKKE